MESEHPVSNDCHFENCSSRAIKEEPPQEVDCGNGGGPEITFVEVKEERVQDDTEQEDKSDNDPMQENLNRMSREPKPGEVCEVYVKSEYSVMDHTDEVVTSVRSNSDKQCKAMPWRGPSVAEGNESTFSHPQVIYTCDICKKSFHHKSNLNTHYNSVHKGLKPYVCNSCNKSFSQKGNLQYHQMCHHNGVKPFICDLCNRTFGKKDHLIVHQNGVHKKLKPFTCEICGKTFVNLRTLQKHKNCVHHGLKPFICETCNKSFGKKTDLINHENCVHFGLRPFKCDLCNAPFGRKNDLIRHHNRLHQKVHKV